MYVRGRCGESRVRRNRRVMFGESGVRRNHLAQEGFGRVRVTSRPLKPQWARTTLAEINGKPCSDYLAHASEVCKGVRLYNGIRRHGIITTHGECVPPLQSVKLL